MAGIRNSIGIVWYPFFKDEDGIEICSEVTNILKRPPADDARTDFVNSHVKHHLYHFSLVLGFTMWLLAPSFISVCRLAGSKHLPSTCTPCQSPDNWASVVCIPPRHQNPHRLKMDQFIPSPGHLSLFLPYQTQSLSTLKSTYVCMYLVHFILHFLNVYCSHSASNHCLLPGLVK